MDISCNPYAVEARTSHATLISSLETEIAALVLAIKQAVMYFEDNAMNKQDEARPVDYLERL